MAQHDFISVVVFAAIACGTYAVLTLFDPHRLRVQTRVDDLLAADDKKHSRRSAQADSGASLLSSVVDLLQRAVPNRTADRTCLQKRLAKAGIYDPIAVPRFYAWKLLLTAIPPIVAATAWFLGYVNMNSALLLGFVAGGAGLLAPTFWLDRRIARRHLSLRRSLPDFLDLMIVCLEGGLSLQESIRRVSEELQIAHPSLAYELGVVQRDIELGASVDQALKRFAARTDYEGVRTLSTFIREAQRFGTNITDSLRSHADMLRSQREQAAEENAQKAAVKILLPTLLLIFPAIFVVLVGPAIIQIQEAFARR